MPESMSIERQKIMTAYGAELVLTPKETGMKGSVDKANELKAKYPNSFIPMQFANPDNPKAHQKTADEIYQALDGQQAVVVAGIGTGGTACGIKKYLKDSIVFGVEPAESPLFTKGFAGPHKIQGIGANFVPEIARNNNLDGIITVIGDNAINEAKDLARHYGIFCGISAGANVYAAKQLALQYHEKPIVAIIPDSGERYLSVW